MSAVIVVLPAVRVERHRDPDEVLLRLVVPRATARALQKVAHEHWDGDLARFAADLLRHFAEVIDGEG